MATRISMRDYYATYHGHDVDHLEIAHDVLRQRHESVIFLAGDSTLDNKVWFGQQENALNGYEDILAPPRMKTDVCYWINHEIMRRGVRGLCCLNTAVEATLLKDRACCHLLQQDRFINRNITDQDYLIVSIGGNDIALKPLLCTIVNLLVLTLCIPEYCIENCGCGCVPNTCIDGGCCCCGLPACLTGWPFACPPGLGYFIDMFKNQIQNYIWRILGCTKPRKVIVCMVYYPDERATGSWADAALSGLNYDQDPGKLQSAIRAMFRLAVSRICVPGVEVEAFPLFEVLDGKQTSDYVARVEPSVQGGRKMATALVDAVLDQASGRAPSQQEME